jgi:hypothetical protein
MKIEYLLLIVLIILVFFIYKKQENIDTKKEVGEFCETDDQCVSNMCYLRKCT